jgi:outer membrane protein OmpA-like peptidoglycan-associated protein
MGDYYDHWSKHDINPEKQAYYNYLATEHYAKGIKFGQGDEKRKMQLKLAALESGTEDITPVGIRSIKPYARLNIRVLFEFNSSELTAGGQEQLDVLGQYLAEGNSSRIILEGHTDMAGAEDYNMMLSVERAKSAKNYLVSQFNLSPEIIEIHGYGFERLADVVDPFGSKNRRVRVRKLPAN